MSRVAVIGGGPSGMLASAMAARNGHDVVLFERNEKLGKKLYITGKGRANFTNTADNDAFFANVVHNPKFLFSAYRFFSNTEIIKLIEENGTPVKIERGGRVFPTSDKSSDVIKALTRNLENAGVTVKLNSRIEQITTQNNSVTGVILDSEQLRFDAVILCTGGLSYPATGSTGDGLRFAEALGHRIVTPHGALVPIETLETWPFELSGLALKNVRLTLFVQGKLAYSDQGEMLFTHFGVSGPLVLSASSHLKPDEIGRAHV
jgi:predicted Rossmann fold flavoprotein